MVNRSWDKENPNVAFCYFPQTTFWKWFGWGHVFTDSWWRHQMETFSMLLAFCAGNSPVTGEFPAQRLVTRSLDICCDFRLNERLSKQWWGWWFETPSSPLWRHCNVNSMYKNILDLKPVCFINFTVILVVSKLPRMGCEHFLEWQLAIGNHLRL